MRSTAFFFCLALVLTCLAMASPARAELTDKDKTAVKEIISDYLTRERPDVIMDAMRELQKRDQASAEAKSAEGIKGKKDQIFNDPASPVGGNPKGDVTIVEFYDYQCGYCKMTEPFIERILKEDKNVRFIYKEFPVLGDVSHTAAKAALAAHRQGLDKFVAFHDALMNRKERLNDEAIYDLAKKSGLAIDRLKKDMADADIEKTLQANLDLGTDIGVRGTPFFIINDKSFPGAIQYEQMKKAVDEARVKK